MEKFARRAVIAGFVTLAMVAPCILLAAEPAGGKGERVALQGYDPVAYFADGHPEKGSAEFSASFDGASYWFKNADHRALFTADPDHYAPRFNGYCTVMVSRGVRYEANPELWAIADGKLWVFGGPGARSAFQEKSGDIIAKATENWSEVRQKTVQ